MLCFSSFAPVYQSELQYLQQLQAHLFQMIRSSPPGSLHIHRRCGKLYFGVRQRGSNGKFHERHLPENDLLLQAYIRKYCAGKVLSFICEAISVLQNNPGAYDIQLLQVILADLQQKLGSHLPEEFYTNQAALFQWAQQVYQSNDFKSEELTVRTLRGEFVRSKLECLCADTMYSMGIPYHYEKALLLKNGRVLYPDFEILSPVSGKTYYLEVCGLMDNEEYRDRLFHRIDLLAENDIVLGNNLLLVFESANHPVNRSSFEKMLKETVLAI